MDIQLASSESGCGRKGEPVPGELVSRPRMLPALSTLSSPRSHQGQGHHPSSSPSSPSSPATTYPTAGAPARVAGSGSPFMGRRGLELGLGLLPPADSSPPHPTSPRSPSRDARWRPHQNAAPQSPGVGGARTVQVNDESSFSVQSSMSASVHASATKIKTNGSLPRQPLPALQDTAADSSLTLQHSGAGRSSPSLSPEPKSAPIAVEEVLEFMDAESPTTATPSAQHAASFGSERQLDKQGDRLSSVHVPQPKQADRSRDRLAEYSLDALDIVQYSLAPAQPAVALRRQMSLRVTSSNRGVASPSPRSSRRFAQCLQMIAELKRQLQELDVQQSEMVMELDLERALLQEECNRVLAKSHSPNRPSSLTNRPPRQPSSTESELRHLKTVLATLEKDLQVCGHRLSQLQPRSAADYSAKAALAALREEMESKRRQYENTEYRILEAELALEEEQDERRGAQYSPEPAPMVSSRDMLALNAQMKALFEETQRQTDMLSARRHVLLEQLQEQYATLQRMSDYQAHQDSQARASKFASLPRQAVRATDPSATSVTRSLVAARPLPSSRVTSPPLSQLLPLQPARVNRPLTRYLPQWDKDVDLEDYLESCGHNLDLCGQFVHLDGSTLAGWLGKLCGRFGLYKKRWFVLDCRSKTLSYAKNKSQRAGLFVVGFEHIEDVFVVHDAGGGRREVGEAARATKCTFCLATLQRRFYLRAPNAAVMRLWVEALSIGAEGSTSEFWQNS